MKSIIGIALSSIILLGCASTNQKEEFTRVVEASCGQCNFGMMGDKCELAVKVDGKHYFVEGSELKEHGDPHTEVGMCTVVRKAKVTGRIRAGAFVASSFELIEE